MVLVEKSEAQSVAELAERLPALCSRAGPAAPRELVASWERRADGAVPVPVPSPSPPPLPAGLSRGRFPSSESRAGDSAASRPLLREAETKLTEKPSQKRAEN